MVWRDSLMKQLWDTNIKGKMWRMISRLYEHTESCVRVNGTETDYFKVKQGVAQGYPLSPTLFNIFVNTLNQIHYFYIRIFYLKAILSN